MAVRIQVGQLLSKPIQPKKKGHDYDVIYRYGEQTIDLSSVIKDD